MSKLTLRDLEVRGQRVLVRVDFNVPVEERDGKVVITDDTRIRESLPTINWLREHGAKTILMAHFGRPKGKRVDKYTLRPVADHLHTLINHPVIFSHDTIGEVPEKIVAHMNEGDVALLENLRRVSVTVTAGQRERDRAGEWVDQMVEIAAKEPANE